MYIINDILAIDAISQTKERMRYVDDMESFAFGTLKFINRLSPQNYLIVSGYYQRSRLFCSNELAPLP